MCERMLISGKYEWLFGTLLFSNNVSIIEKTEALKDTEKQNVYSQILATLPAIHSYSHHEG